MHPRCFARLNFTVHRTLVLEVERAASYGLLVSNTAPRCSSSALHNSPLMMMPRSTPLLFGSLTWKVPLLGTTDSGEDLEWREVRVCCRISILCTKRNHLNKNWYLQRQTPPPPPTCWPELSLWVADGPPPECRLQSGSRWWTVVCRRPATAHTYTGYEQGQCQEISH